MLIIIYQQTKRPNTKTDHAHILLSYPFLSQNKNKNIMRNNAILYCCTGGLLLTYSSNLMFILLLSYLLSIIYDDIWTISSVSVSVYLVS